MASVSRKEGFRYGFYIFAYWLVLLAFSAALVAVGSWVVSEQVGEIGVNREGGLAALGGFVAVLGVLVFGSGQTGLVYKVVADGVAAGAGSRDRGTSSPTAGPGATGEATPGDDERSTVGASDAGDGAAATAGQPDGPEPEKATDPSAPEPAGATGEATPEGRPAASDDSPVDEGDEQSGSPDRPTPRPRNRRPGDASPGQRPSGDRAAAGDGATDRESESDTGGEGAGGQRREQSGPGPSDGDGESAPVDARASEEGTSRADAADTGSGADEAVVAPEDDPESPADVASESGMAEELGFEQGEQSRETDDAVTGPTDSTAGGRSAGGASEEPAGNDDPLAPDSGFAGADGESASSEADSTASPGSGDEDAVGPGAATETDVEDEETTIFEGAGTGDVEDSKATDVEETKTETETETGAGTETETETDFDVDEWGDGTDEPQSAGAPDEWGGRAESGGESESGSETGSLSDALSGDDPEVAGDDAEDGSDDGVPEWTTGGDRVSEEDESDGR